MTSYDLYGECKEIDLKRVDWRESAKIAFQRDDLLQALACYALGIMDVMRDGVDNKAALKPLLRNRCRVLFKLGHIHLACDDAWQNQEMQLAATPEAECRAELEQMVVLFRELTLHDPAAQALALLVQRHRRAGDTSDQRAQLRTKDSILDSATDEMARFQARLGASDRAVVSDYLDVLREVERRIQQTEAKNAESPLPEYERPGIGVPERFDDHVKLMFDLQCLAYQGDVTRVSTFMYGAEQRARMYPEIGLNESHHTMSHHGDNPENLAKYAKLCTWHVELFAYLVDKMRSTPDGDGSLLDHSLMMIGGGMSNGNIHSHMDVPIALVGGAGDTRGNRHIAAPMGTPLSNLQVSLLNHAGVPVESFGDSTGVLDLNALPAKSPSSA